MESNQNKDFNKESEEVMNRWFDFFKYSQERQNFSSDQFRALQIQIASILFGASMFFIKDIKNYSIISIKIIFFIALFLLLISLSLGLINTHIISIFWGKNTKKCRLVYNKWKEAYIYQITNKEAYNYEQGITKGEDTYISIGWAWKLQTLFLLLALLLIIVLNFIVVF